MSHLQQLTGYRVKKMADPVEKKMLNVADPHFSQCGGPLCEGG